MVDFQLPGAVGSARAGRSSPTQGSLRASGRIPPALALDLLQIALDLTGFVDPTPASDGANALICIGRGRWLDAALSGISIIPYIGDLAKAGKLPRYLRTIEEAVRLAERSATAAMTLVPALRRIRQALDLLPTAANRHLQAMRARLDQLLIKSPGKPVLKTKPDVRDQFAYPDTYKQTLNGTEYDVQEVSGRLGIPSLVKQHRSKSAQSSVSSGSGDDAGHLIANRFGAAGGRPNLALQNHVQNRGAGTYHHLERLWTTKLEAGVGIQVRVRVYSKGAGTRPLHRNVQWTETALDGSKTSFEVDFLNTHTSLSRQKQNVAPTLESPQIDNVYDLFSGKKL